MIKKNIKLLIGIIIGGIVFGSVGVYGAGKLYANSIEVDTSKMSELGETSNVNLALDYLYGVAANVTSNSGPSIYPSSFSKGVIAVITLDPTDLTKKCGYSNVVSTNGTRQGCMKWYVYKETFDKYIAILDHNIGYSSYSTSIPYISNWQKGTGKLTVRYITVDEIAEIIGLQSYAGNGTWYLDTATTSRDTTIDTAGESNYGWLFDYTYTCTNYGCNVAENTFSTGAYWYWTGTQSTGSCSDGTYSQYQITYEGAISALCKGSNGGIRPVIEIPKTLFN